MISARDGRTPVSTGDDGGLGISKALLYIGAALKRKGRQ